MRGEQCERAHGGESESLGCVNNNNGKGVEFLGLWMVHDCFGNYQTQFRLSVRERIIEAISRSGVLLS